MSIIVTTNGIIKEVEDHPHDGNIEIELFGVQLARGFSKQHLTPTKKLECRIVLKFKKEISPTWTLYAIFCCASNENSQNTIHFNSITKNMTKRHLFPFTFNREKKPI